MAVASMKGVARWFPPSARVALIIGALVVFGIVDVDVFLPKVTVSRENNSVVFKHGGWERMGLRNRSRNLAPGNRLQPLDELAGAKKASPYGGVLPPSPYASLRKCKRFLGNIRTTAVLKSALQARTHKSEVILVPFSDPELPLALNMALNLRKLSFDHFLLLGLDKACCLHAAAVISDIGCVWTTYLADGDLDMFPRDGPEGDRDMEKLQLLRWHTAARIVRQGINVLTMDAEGHLSDDPYAYLKAVPLQTANLVTMTHGGWGMTSGLVYVQNAAVDGPVAWALADTVYRVLQYAEHPGFLEEKGLSSPGSLLEMLRDSSLLSDATISTCVGRPMGWHSLYHTNWGRTKSEDTLKRIDDAHLQLAEKECRLRDIDIDLDPELQARLGISGGHFFQLPLQIPEEPAEWPDALGGRVVPTAAGKLAREWRALLEAEEGTPWNGTTTELLLQPLMYGRYMEYGHNGLRNGAFYVEPRPVFFAHMMGIRAPLKARPIVMKALGMWHWEVVSMLEEVGFQQGAPLTERKVLAFAPDALPLRLDSERQVRAALMGLVQLAVLSGRVPVWPDFACDLPWLYEEGALKKRRVDEKRWFGMDWRADLEVVPRQPVDGVPSSRRCLVWHYYDTSCNVHGMNLMDFFFLRDELLPPDKGLPSARNTILHDSKEEGTARYSSTADIDWLDSYMKKIKDEPIAYLGRTVNIESLGSREGLEEAVEKIQSSCLAGMFQISMDRKRYATIGAQDVDKGEEVALEEIRALEEEPPADVDRREGSVGEAAAAASSVGEEADRQADKTARQAAAKLAASRNDNTDTIEELDPFANLEEQINRRAEAAQEGVDEPHERQLPRSVTGRVSDEPKQDIEPDEDEAPGGDAKGTKPKQGAEPDESYSEPYDYDEDSEGPDQDAAGGVKRGTRGKTEERPGKVNEASSSRREREIDGGDVTEGSGLQFADEDREEKERDLRREREGEADREPLQETGSREEASKEAAGEVVDEEAEMKQAEIDAIAAEEAEKREAEREAAAAEASQREVREREAARLADLEKRQQEIRQAQERAAAEDKRQNEADRAELDLEGGGGELLDPQQLGFHEPGQGTERASEEAPGVSDDGGERVNEALRKPAAKDEGERGGEAEADKSEEEGNSRQTQTDLAELDVSDEDPGVRIRESSHRPLPLHNLGEPRPGGHADDGLMSRDASSAEERDVVEMGRMVEGDLSRSGGDMSRGNEAVSSKEIEPQTGSNSAAGPEVDSPDTLVLGGRSRKERGGNVEVKPVLLAGDGPRLVGYRRSKDESAVESTDVNGERNDGEVETLKKEEIEKGDDEMEILDEDDARPT